MKNQSKKGFTLVELLVVISIIGLLSTIAVVSLGSARGKSRDAKRIADMKQVSTALEQYYADQGNYPASATSGAAASGQVIGTSATTDTLTNSAAGFGTGTSGTVYMGRIPLCPGTLGTTCTATAAGTPPATYIQNYCYYTTTTSAATDYTLTVKLEATNPAAGINATNCKFTSSGMTCS
jgi:prepilin-type N-terminal cleavage/methylation domain-containing protein